MLHLGRSRAFRDAELILLNCRLLFAPQPELVIVPPAHDMPGWTTQDNCQRLRILVFRSAGGWGDAPAVAKKAL